ncbi:MAG: class I SAM-dependent methyltransferase [Ferrovibrio sp.]|uniref:class I SAM-dependent methyltransferase n=1 Tax=Ferrovibrio sp. TaxID=1917215 RepID=UPI00261D2B98|nr:class I SAM-dependent methyltransferase [Ferrovibrio sp.]MCW0234839.1 class I SAM-dependent methyltransferase [Ferrovibrio sp.]
MTISRQTYLKRGYRRIGGWLFPYSARFIDSLLDLQLESGVQGAVGEIGVHHGKLFLLLALGRRPGESAFAIDVFDDQHLNLDRSGAGDRDIFLANARRWLEPANRLDILQRSSLDVRPDDLLRLCGPVRLASIDGGHTEDCVLNDLALIGAVLAPRGVVVLDDNFNEFWPDVSSGVARYLFDPAARLRPFAITPNKTYFAAAEDAGFYRRALRNRNGYYFEKTARLFGNDVDIFGTQAYSFSLKKRVIEWVRHTPVAPYARALRATVRRLAR